MYLQKHFVITNNLLLQIVTCLPVYFVEMICIFYLLICYQQAALCSVVCGPSVVSPSTPTPTSSLLCLIISIKHDFSSIHPTFHLPYRSHYCMESDFNQLIEVNHGYRTSNFTPLTRSDQLIIFSCTNSNK